MKLLSIFAALICACCLLCISVSATEFPEQTDESSQTEHIEHTTPTLMIDNTHIYEHMQQSYAQGYAPLVDGDDAIIVLPLSCEGDEKPESLRVSVELPPNSPFLMRNYEQAVPLAEHMDANGDVSEIYLITFHLAMKAERENGCYPIQLQVAEFGSYTVYVTITDGIDPNAEEPEPIIEMPSEPWEEPVILMPKILVQGVTGGAVQAGETAQVHITLKNTSRSESLQNLTVTASAPSPFSLHSADTLYFEQIAANAEFEVIFCCQTTPDADAGSYVLPLQFDFAYGKGMSGAGSGNVRIDITQPVRMSFPQVILPAEAVVSDRLELHLQAINLGVTAAQNVRAEIHCDGLLPDGTAFFGNVSGGTSADTNLNVQVTSKRGAELYGETAGQILFTYTDESGNDRTETQDFTLILESPFRERITEPEQVSPKYWIWIMFGIAGGVLCLSAYLFVRSRKQVRS